MGRLACRFGLFLTASSRGRLAASCGAFMIIFGIVALAVTAVVGFVFIIAWALVPVLPLLGAGLAIVGWLPW